MTIAEALERVQRDRPGEATEDELRKWLREMDTRWRGEVLDTHWKTVEELGAEPALLKLELRDTDVYFRPKEGDDASGSYPVVYEPAFDPKEDIHVGAVHTTSADAKSQLFFVCAPGVRVLPELEIYPQGDINVVREDGKTWIKWGSDSDGAAYALLTVLLTVTDGESTRQYTLCIDRYYDGQAASSGLTPMEAGNYRGLIRNTDASTSLLIPEPDDEVYLYWLYAHIDMRLGETDRYNNDATLYNATWLQAAKRYNRGHRPKGHLLRHVVYGSMPLPPPLPEDPLDQHRDWFGFRG